MSEIVVKNLTKKFGDVTALDNVSLTFEKEKIYALLGKNGAGKSTLLSLITNRNFASSGQVVIDGKVSKENDSIQNHIFCMSEGCDYPLDMKAKHAFKWAKLYYPNFDLAYANELTIKFKLDVNKKIGKLSTGYKSIYKLILTLASGVEVYIFDEPALGLDASMRELFYSELLSFYAKEPKTIIVSTHLIEEIASIIEHVIILKEGKVIVNDSAEAFLKQGYKVQGEKDKVDSFLKDKKILKVSELGRLKSASVFGVLSKEDKKVAEKMDVEIVSAGLQELFVSISQ